MLTSLLPGVRSLRSAFLTGALLLASVFVLVRGDSSSKPHVRTAAQNILDLTPQMRLLLLVMACLLTGSLYITGLEGGVDWIHRKLALVDRHSYASAFKRRLVGTLAPLSDAARTRLTVEAERFFREFVPGPATGDGNAMTADSRAFVDTVLTDVLWMDGKLAGSPLREPYDEYRSEGELRLGIALLLPLGAFATCYALRLDWRWLVLVVAISLAVSARLASYGLYYYRRAHSFLAHHIADGVLLAPCMETMRRTSRAAPRSSTSTVVE